MCRRILVPVNASEASDRGVREAIRLARNASTSLRFVHVVDQALVAAETASFSGTIDEFLERLQAIDVESQVVVDVARRHAEHAGVACTVAVRKCDNGSLPDAVAAEALAWHADVIVMGAGIGRRSQSASTRILRAVPIPVMKVLARPALCLSADVGPQE